MQGFVDDIRAKYTKDWSSKDLFKQQMGVALYFIDKLALRAGHEKDEDEADTVGCCTLKVKRLFKISLPYPTSACFKSLPPDFLLLRKAQCQVMGYRKS